MNLTKGILIGLVSVMALSQEGSAEKVGTCLAPNEFFIIKDNLKYNFPPRKFTKASFGIAETRAVFCQYDDSKFAATLVIPEEYSFRTCNFNNEKGKDSCVSNNINDCVVYCDKK